MSKSIDDEFLWDQFCRLGEMMGDGLHHEADGRWISKEYNRLAKILIPEIKEAHSIQRKQRNANRDEQMAKLIEKFKCRKCGGNLKQSRSGSKIMHCEACNARYTATSKANQNE
ncbi:MAG: hypothetical protein A2W93_14160 [Bacteroidetes bacterium GWF2_43_63]|nr:MAG: hypothetical protein A2W94_00730 [Bacteroidetes bacterium GWE2_42_42]OFY52485.1 MAG: hypothetical protein A2W93_14160 [Bacteroidetes bacterium GWF2_43_63]HBG71391.1 hypothetical protein [Bacteroidales bacterium]HCB60857.1 hypothetical protein [Bacteroidales bacterium]HCY23418.1 hypothetical protein [Bacteroidales bacterium]